MTGREIPSASTVKTAPIRDTLERRMEIQKRHAEREETRKGLRKEKLMARLFGGRS